MKDSSAFRWASTTSWRQLCAATLRNTRNHAPQQCLLPFIDDHEISIRTSSFIILQKVSQCIGSNERNNLTPERLFSFNPLIHNLNILNFLGKHPKLPKL
jgi:hypothetical protein